MHWHFTVKKNNIKKHMTITSWHLISIIIAKNNKQNMFKMILRIEFIDTETIKMYEKLHCERHGYIFYGILNYRLPLISYLYIFYIWMNTFYTKQHFFEIRLPDFKEMLLLNPHRFIYMFK